MSRLSQLLENELRSRGRSERELAKEFDWSQQAFNTWLKGSVPRKQFWDRIARFLSISVDDVEALAEEAKESTGSTKLPTIDPVWGKVTDRKAGRYVFPDESGMRFPLTRYCIRIDTKVMEPALLVGTRAWADPSRWPAVGNEVIAHTKSGAAWIGRLFSIEANKATIEQYGSDKKTIVDDIAAVHVIVSSQRIADAT